MNKNTRNGLVAAGLAAVAYWFKGMTPEQRQSVKDKVTGTGKKLQNDFNNAVNSAKNKVDETTTTV